MAERRFTVGDEARLRVIWAALEAVQKEEPDAAHTRIAQWIEHYITTFDEKRGELRTKLRRGEKQPSGNAKRQGERARRRKVE